MKPSEILHFYFESHTHNNTKTIKIKSPLPSVLDFLLYFSSSNSGKHLKYLTNEARKIFFALESKGYLVKTGITPSFEEQCYIPDIGYKELLYGTPDFEIFGFPYTRKTFSKSVIPIIIKTKEGDYDIGSSFLINYDDKDYLITAKHCIENKHLISIPNRYIGLIIESIYISANPYKDIAVIKLIEESFVSEDIKKFGFDNPNVLDRILTMGYPTIPGFKDSIQIAETGTISAELKSAIGEITGTGDNYHLDSKSFLISARVKGGNSGSPVINERGKVVGVVAHELLSDTSSINTKLDELGYGVAQSSMDILEIILNIEQNKVKKIKFNAEQCGKWITTRTD